MMVPPLKVTIFGMPAPFATAREVEWKENIAAGVSAAWQGKGYLEVPCQISLIFKLLADKAAVTDIDNLLKPCIDAIGSALFKPGKFGHRVKWNTEDHWIYRLVAEKRVESDPTNVGVEILVEPLKS